ncbi:SGNH/GDSL hydrolase family protein [Dyella psychrodurans]|uniref:SGNH/GDSL hydrolase family protein n=1 Tax=Dyella psychrodurans TaxID=1927960 RepID=A0A370WW48_9GAMM|nr:SGNH/GDSL hydrolase family protein [Dyella psychrodurans]RDS80354.1 SGNH/GDSL hydrolase family protein [Dyella psychrodurans]
MTASMLKRSVFGVLLCVLSVGTCAASTDEHWVTAWGAAPDAFGPALKAQTVREVIRTSIGGSAVRIRLSNLYGQRPVMIGPVHIALRVHESAIQPGGDHVVTFNGKQTVTVAEGGSVLSDPIAMQVTPMQDIAISLYVPKGRGPSTIHANGLATAYVTENGDATSAETLGNSEVSANRFFLTEVDVDAGESARAVVAFGDSITDGIMSTPNANHRWPDVFAERLQADPKLSSIAVVNSGISGNRILHDGGGPSALSRFDRDALDKPGVHWIVLLEGINDIGASGQPSTPEDNVSAQQIIDGMKTLISKAHAKGIKIFGATLTPFGGAGWPYHTAAGEEKRQAVNAWIRTSGAFDAVIDFDKVVRDPAHPDRFLPEFDSGDHLHPGDAGYRAMADSIDLSLFAKG